MSFARTGIQIVGFVSLVMFSAACSSRPRRAVVVEGDQKAKPAPGAQQEPGSPEVKQPPAATPPGTTPPVATGPETKPDGSVVDPTKPPVTNPPATTTPDGTVPATGGGTVPSTTPPPSSDASAGVTPDPAGGKTDIIISTTLDDGTTDTFQWDGSSFKGNDKWDIKPL